MESRHARLPADLPHVDVGLGELVDEGAVTKLGRDVDRGEAHLESTMLQVSKMLTKLVVRADARLKAFLEMLPSIRRQLSHGLG